MQLVRGASSAVYALVIFPTLFGLKESEQMQSPIRSFVQSAIVQAFLGAAVSLVLLTFAEQADFGWVMWRGGGAYIVGVVFLGILGYRLIKDYLSRRDET